MQDMLSKSEDFIRNVLMQNFNQKVNDADLRVASQKLSKVFKTTRP